MQTPANSWTAAPHADDDCITIVASTVKDVMRQFRESGLAEKGYSIVGRAARQSFAFASDTGDQPMFDGHQMVAATFIRAAAR